MIRYFSFGERHVHRVNGFTYDTDVLVKIDAPDPRAVMVRWFGREWGFEYQVEPSPAEIADYWPRGIKDLPV